MTLLLCICRANTALPEYSQKLLTQIQLCKSVFQSITKTFALFYAHMKTGFAVQQAISKNAIKIPTMLNFHKVLC